MEPISKPSLRAQMKARLASIRREDAAGWSARACDLAATLLPNSGVVLLYVPMGHELDVRALAKQCLGHGLRVALPLPDWAARSMSARLVRSLDPPHVVPGRHATFDPAPDSIEVSPGEIDVAFVPGLAFDERGGRLGRGAGFYDRFLASGVRFACGIAFEFQVVASIPREPHDASVDALVTDERVRAGLGGPRP